ISSRTSVFFGSLSSPRLPFSVDTMGRQGSGPSAASTARTSVVLSKAVERSFALEAEVSRLRHHVGVLSRRLHIAGKDLDEARSIICVVCAGMGECPSEAGSLPLVGEEVAVPEEVAEVVVVAPSVASDMEM